jgi:DNA-binding protein Fis
VNRAGFPARLPTIAALSLDEVERQHVAEALRVAGGNQSEAARLLGIRRQTLRRKMQKYGIPFG